QPQHPQERSSETMAPESSARAFPLHPNARVLGEYGRMLLQHSHPAGAEAKRAPLKKGVEGLPDSLSPEIQRESHPIHVDQRSRAPPANHRSYKGISDCPPQQG